MLRPGDLSDLVPRMALNCNVPSEARVIRKVGSQAERGAYPGLRVIKSIKSPSLQRLTSLELSNGQISRGLLSSGQLS